MRVLLFLFIKHLIFHYFPIFYQLYSFDCRSNTCYFLQPLVYKFEMFLDSFQNKKLIKYSHTISSIFVFVVFVLIIVVLMIAIIPALVNYVVNIADNLTLYIKNFEKTLETYLGSNLASEVIIKIDEMVVKYVNSIEAIVLLRHLGLFFKAGSTDYYQLF